MPRLLLPLVQFQGQSVRVGEERESLAGVLINPRRSHDEPAGLEFPHGFLDVGDLERQVPQAAGLGVARSLRRVGEWNNSIWVPSGSRRSSLYESRSRRYTSPTTSSPRVST